MGDDHVRCPTRANIYANMRPTSPSSSSSSWWVPFMQTAEQVSFTGCKWAGKIDDIRAHLKTCEYVEQQCPKCQDNFPRKYLSAHVNSCNGKGQFSCPVCFVSFPTLDSSLPHIYECENRPVICDYCKTKLPFKYMVLHTDECDEYPLF